VQAKLTRRELGTLMTAALAASVLDAQTSGPVLDIAEWSYH